VLDLRQITALREKLVVQGYPCLVAVRDGTVAGFAFAQAFGEREAWRGTVEAVVAVHPDATGHGVGRALLAGLIAACDVKGFRQMIAVIPADAAGEASEALHQALGFAHAGVLRGVGLRLGAPVDSLLMQRALGIGSPARSAA
jgi:phosphinothricin acetyltransferase